MIIKEEHKELFKIDLMELGDDGSPITQDALGNTKAFIIKKRQKLVQPYKSFKRSSAQKNSWRKGRYKHLSGIRAFSRSVAGKRFHRRLGQFMANNSMYYGESANTIDRYEIVEFLTTLNSYKTHLFIELGYYAPFYEEIDFLLATEEVLEFIDELSVDIFNHISEYRDFHLTHEIIDSVIRILDFDNLLETLSKMSGKTIDEVKIFWKKAESSICEACDINEDDNTYYSKVLGIACKLLDITQDTKLDIGDNNE